METIKYEIFKHLPYSFLQEAPLEIVAAVLTSALVLFLIMMGILRVWLNKSLFTKNILFNVLLVAGLIVLMLAASSHKLYVKSEVFELCGKFMREKPVGEMVVVESVKEILYVAESVKELLYYAEVINNPNQSNQDILQGLNRYCVNEKEELENMLASSKGSWKWHRWGLIVLTILLAVAAVLTVYLKYRKQMKLENNAQ